DRRDLPRRRLRRRQPRADQAQRLEAARERAQEREAADAGEDEEAREGEEDGESKEAPESEAAGEGEEAQMKATGPVGQLVLTCEHAGNKIPPGYSRLFRGADDVLASHRGWDPGALTLARALAKRLRRPLHFVTWSRLLVESNRAPHNPRIWSAF